MYICQQMFVCDSYSWKSWILMHPDLGGCRKTGTGGGERSGSKTSCLFVILTAEKSRVLIASGCWWMQKNGEKRGRAKWKSIKLLTGNERDANLDKEWSGRNCSWDESPHVVVVGNPTSLFSIQCRPSGLGFCGIENAHQWSCCCYCCWCFFKVLRQRLSPVLLDSVRFQLLLLLLLLSRLRCCSSSSSWSAWLQLLRTPQLEVRKWDPVRTEGLR